jgi:hypothetical protein
MTDAAQLDQLLAEARSLNDDDLLDLLRRSPGLMPLLARLEKISGQLLKSGLKRIDSPEGADGRAIRVGWLRALLRLDALARLDGCLVSSLARGGTWQQTVDCPCGCGTNMKQVFLIDSKPSRN